MAVSRTVGARARAAHLPSTTATLVSRSRWLTVRFASSASRMPLSRNNRMIVLSRRSVKTGRRTSAQPTSLVEADHCDGLLGHFRPLHALHRRAGHLLLIDEPAEELLERPEPHRDSGGAEWPPDRPGSPRRTPAQLGRVHDAGVSADGGGELRRSLRVHGAVLGHCGPATTGPTGATRHSYPL